MISQSKLTMQLSERLDLFETLAKDLSDGTDDGRILTEFLQKASTLRCRFESTHQGYGDPVIIPIIGKNRIGKSYFLNQFCAITERESDLYNLTGSELSSDAATIATRVYCNAFHNGGIDTDIFDRFRDEILQLDWGSQAETKKWGHQTSIIRSWRPKVSWHLPDRGNLPGGNYFNEKGELNRQRKPIDEHYLTIEEVKTAFECYGTEGRQALSDKHKAFLLPSNESPSSVTGHNTYIWGGDRYAMIVKFIVADKIDRWIENITSSYEKEAAATGGDSTAIRKYRKSLLMMLITVLHCLKNGAPKYPGSGLNNDAAIDAFKDQVEESKKKCKNNVANFLGNKDLFLKKGGLVAWWKETGKISVSAKDDPTDLTYPNIHNTMETCFDQIVVYQGKGNVMHDDRIYIKAKLAHLVGENNGGFAMVDEVHLLVPSADLSPYSALVDTPGVDDTDLAKQLQLTGAIKEATGFLVYLDVTLNTAESTLTALTENDVLLEAVKASLRQPNDDGDHRRNDTILFVHCYEKNKPRLALDEQDERSVLNQSFDTDRAKDKRKEKNAVKEAIIDKIGDHLSANPADIPELGGPFSMPSECRDAIDTRVAKAMSDERCRFILPTLYRAVTCQSNALSTAEKYLLHKTGMNEMMKSLRIMLTDSVTAKEIGTIAEKCKALHDVLKPIPALTVPPEVHEHAKSLLSKHIKHGDLRKSVVERIKNSTCSADLKNKGSEWAKRVCDGIFDSLTDMGANIFRSMKTGYDMDVLALHVLDQFQTAIEDAKGGKLFNTENILGKKAYDLCKGRFTSTELWEEVFQPAATAIFTSIRDKDFWPFIKTSFNEHLADGYEEAPTVKTALRTALETSFNVAVSVNRIRETFFRKATQHFNLRPNTFFKTAKKSLPQNVLNTLFKEMLSEAQSILFSRRNLTKHKSELVGLFSKENLEKHRRSLEDSVRKEVDDLINGFTEALCGTFQTKRSGTRTRKIIAQTFEHVSKCDLVADAETKQKVCLAKQTCSEVQDIAQSFAKLEQGSDDRLGTQRILVNMELKKFNNDKGFQKIKLLPAFKKIRPALQLKEHETWSKWETFAADCCDDLDALGTDQDLVSEVLRNRLQTH